MLYITRCNTMLLITDQRGTYEACWWGDKKYLPLSRQYTYKSNIVARSLNHFCRGKAISFTYSELVSVALFIQHAKRMRQIVLLVVVCLTLPYFTHYLINGTIFRKKFAEHKMCLLIFSTTFAWNISYSKKNSARYYHKCT